MSSLVVPSTMEAAAASRSFWVAMVSSMSLVAVMVVSAMSPALRSCRLGVATIMNTPNTTAKPSASVSTDSSVPERNSAETFRLPRAEFPSFNRFISSPDF